MAGCESESCIEFEACGLDLPREGEAHLVTGTQVAPSYGPHCIVPRSISMISGLTEKFERGELECVVIYVQGNRAMLVGSYAEVKRKLGYR